MNTAVFNAVVAAFFDTWAAQFTFAELIFPNVVESIITVSSNLNKYGSIHLHLCAHRLLLFFITPHLQKIQGKTIFSFPVTNFFLL